MNRLFINRIALAATLAVAALVINLPAANAQVVFSENFNSPAGVDGRILFDAAPSYDGIEDSESLGITGGDNDGNALQNGNIIQSEPFVITQDQSGTGFFLFNQTSAGTIDGEVWGTITPVAVAQNTDYVFSFYLTNQNTTDNGQIESFINGVSVGGPSSAVGTFQSNGWQQFSFNWNSGAATTADLSLVNQRSGGVGNDFGIDTITLTAVANAPEPGTLALLGFGLVGGIIARRKK